MKSCHICLNHSSLDRRSHRLNLLKFEKVTEDWLDFIIACRSERSHFYDIVEGPRADDTIFNYV
ncbi:MAG: DUF3990 domain-containing protein [Turicibacter sp.]|nr:DUF3990 domain-containing protein [Turicibacter sp.]